MRRGAVVIQIDGASYRLREHADLVPENIRMRAPAPPAHKRRVRAERAVVEDA